MPFAHRPPYEWRLRTRSLALGPRTFLMGILNTTPDSFSDGGQFLAPRPALEQALRMLDEGADILDLGGESTRPDAAPVAPEEEQARVLPVLESILKARPGAILSIDTYHGGTARRAVDAGAEIVNDVSGHLWDPAMSSTCAQLACGAILMHTRGRPQEWRRLPALAAGEVVPTVLRQLGDRLDAAIDAGVERARIVADPGFGFGKAFDENYPLLARLEELQTLGVPVMVGVSRKGFLRRTVQEAGVGGPEGRLHRPHDGDGSFGADESVSLTRHRAAVATLAANTAAVLGGAHIVRVHDVASARVAVAIADRLLAHHSSP